MPSRIVRKRQRSSEPETTEPPAKRSARAPHTTPKPTKKKPTLFEVVDSRPASVHSVEENEKFLAELALDDDEDDEFSDVDSDEFEDVIPSPGAKRCKVDKRDEEHHDDDDDMGWEDAFGEKGSSLAGPAPAMSGDLELTLDRIPTQSLVSLTDQHGTKKGPSKIERMIRINTHCMHVQYLLFHNSLRNGWACDKEVKRILSAYLTPGVKQEVERWRKACGDAGVALPEEENIEDDTAGAKGKGKAKSGKPSKAHKNQRDWGNNSGHVESGAPSLSLSDPTLRLLKILCAFWKKRFTITAPGLRKQGYKDMARLEEEVNSHRKDEHRPEEHGERIKGVAEFRKLAKKCEGSRDVGAQLFTALLRSLGLEARLVANLQPVGFGWSKSEDAKSKRVKSDLKTALAELEPNSEDEEDEKAIAVVPKNTPPKKPTVKKATPAKPKATRRSGGGIDQPITLSDDESELSSAPSSDDGKDDDSVIDVTSKVTAKSSRRYDRDLPFPIYWTEVLSRISNTWIPVDSIIFSIIAKRPEEFIVFEPRGVVADRAKQVLAYVVAYSSDGTAKDVTVRYLKKHVWPGRTKGVRIPEEKMPVYDGNGKVLRYESYDWFKTVMLHYGRSSKQRTDADDIEEKNELEPVRVFRKPKSAGEETLQGYKNSAEFVLERFLRREEALLPHTKPVKTFTSGKGDKAKSDFVYLRKDVVTCRTLESWHKEGREVKPGSQPLKHVPMRAVTTIRKREIEEAERETGEKMKQALYSRAQTDWIIPPPILDGMIPKNAFNNIDVYVPTMVPRGAVHLRLKGSARVCKKLGVDFAEACTGFEFGNRRAVPVLTGVVVAKENEHLVKDAWRIDQEEKRKKEQTKREKLALGMWKKFMSGLRIVERMTKEYGDQAENHIQEAIHPMAAKKKGKGKAADDGSVKPRATKKSEPKPDLRDEHDGANDGFLINEIDLISDAGGGFIPDHTASDVGGGGFLPEDNASENEACGFILEDDGAVTKQKRSLSSKPNSKPQNPVSLQLLHQQGATYDAEDINAEDDCDVNLRVDEDIIKPTSPAPRRRGPPKRTSAKPNTAKVDPSSPTESDLSDVNDVPTPKAKQPSRASKVKGMAGEMEKPKTKRRSAGWKSKENVRSRYFVDPEGEDL